MLIQIFLRTRARGFKLLHAIAGQMEAVYVCSVLGGGLAVAEAADDENAVVLGWGRRDVGGGVEICWGEDAGWIAARNLVWF